MKNAPYTNTPSVPQTQPGLYSQMLVPEMRFHDEDDAESSAAGDKAAALLR